jgi:hypothetical protein
VAKRVNPPSAVACLKTSVVAFSHPLDQCSEAQCYFGLSKSPSMLARGAVNRRF